MKGMWKKSFEENTIDKEGSFLGLFVYYWGDFGPNIKRI